MVVLSHVPPFVHEEGEEHGWANWQLDARAAIIAAASRGGARLWLSGHFHGNCVGNSSSGIEVVTTSACGGVINWKLPAGQVAVQPFPDFSKVVGSPAVVADARHSGMRIVRVEEQGFKHAWVTLRDAPVTLDEAFVTARDHSPSRWTQVLSGAGLEHILGLDRERVKRNADRAELFKTTGRLSSASPRLMGVAKMTSVARAHMVHKGSGAMLTKRHSRSVGDINAET